MSYTINKTNGAIITTIADGSLDNTTSLTLIGKNYPGYGQILNDNLVRLLENAANSTAPASPITGQLWYDTTSNILKYYSGTSFKPVASLTSATSAPSSSILTGDLWWDTANQQLKAYSGSTWITIGPAFSAGTGTSGAIVETILSSLGASNTIVSLYAGSTRVAVVSKSDAFTPGTALSGFPTINPGINLANVSIIPGNQLTGTATNANALSGLISTQFMRSDTATSTSGTLSVANNTGMTVGVSNDAKLWVSSGTVILEDQTNAGSIVLKVRDSGGTQSNALTVLGNAASAFSANLTVAGNANIQSSLPSTSTTTGALVVAGGVGVAGNVYVGGNANIAGNANITGNLAVTGNFTLTGAQQFNGNVTLGDNVGTDIVTFNGQIGSNLVPNANATYNLGSSTRYWSTMYGVSTNAQYADLAERYEADDAYAPGTILTLGGDKEVTMAYIGDDVFGVVSTDPAFLMNAVAGTDATHPPVALIGRVPVRVIGTVSKGDKLVMGGAGVATKYVAEDAQDPDNPPADLSQDQLVGRALVNKYTEEEELIEVVLAAH